MVVVLDRVCFSENTGFHLWSSSRVSFMFSLILLRVEEYLHGEMEQKNTLAPVFRKIQKTLEISESASRMFVKLPPIS